MSNTPDFVWWQGVVEDIDDPLKLGRCRVRVIGDHASDKIAVRTEHLPWAQPVLPITSASVSGVGISPTGIVKGSWVVGFYRDGKGRQLPVIFGTLAGIPEVAANPAVGFNDPTGEFPRENYLGEPDVNRLARNENITNTVVQSKTSTAESNIVSALGNQWWKEPITPYNSVYPKNKVLETESGHIEEFDDTPGSERIHRYHKSGTFEEIHPDGTKVTKIVKNSYSLVSEDNRILIKGNDSTNILGNSDTKVQGTCNVEISGSVNLLIRGNMTVECSGNVSHKVGGTYTVVSNGNMTFLAPRIDLNPNGFSSSDIGDPLSSGIPSYDSEGNPQ